MRLALVLMIGGVLWALLGAASMVRDVRQSPRDAVVRVLVTDALFGCPGLVAFGLGALRYHRIPPPGAVRCRTCAHLIARDSPACPRCGEREPTRRPALGRG
jgi:hypothetical protein